MAFAIRAMASPMPNARFVILSNCSIVSNPPVTRSVVFSTVACRVLSVPLGQLVPIPLHCPFFRSLPASGPEIGCCSSLPLLALSFLHILGVQLFGLRWLAAPAGSESSTSPGRVSGLEWLADRRRPVSYKTPADAQRAIEIVANGTWAAPPHPVQHARAEAFPELPQ
jgi:hypothetical protein